MMHGYAVDPNWYVDTGATNHITSDLHHMTTKGRYNGGYRVQATNGADLTISYVGLSSITCSSRPLYVKDILYADMINKHLFSVKTLPTDNDVVVEFHPDYFFVKGRATKHLLLKGRCRNGMYVLPKKPTYSVDQNFLPAMSSKTWASSFSSYS
jgi:hypothetical protein